MSKLLVTIAGQKYVVETFLLPQHSGTVVPSGTEDPKGEVEVIVNGQPLKAVIPDMHLPVDEMEWLIIDNKPYEVILDADLHWIRSHRDISPVEIRDLEAISNRPAGGDQWIRAPIPGLISQVFIATGDHITAGQPLLVLEAMKMEN